MGEEEMSGPVLQPTWPPEDGAQRAMRKLREQDIAITWFCIGINVGAVLAVVCYALSL